MREPPAALGNLLDINLIGAVWFTRLAIAYLQHGADHKELVATLSKSLTLVSSAQAFLEVPGLYGYSTSKHGLLGLVRSMRRLAPQQCGVRVNLMAPSATATPLIGNSSSLFTDNGVPLNSADDVGLYIQVLGADRTLNGKAVYVVGGKGFDVEEGLDRLLPQWLGEENAKAWELHNEVFGKVSCLTLALFICACLLSSLLTANYGPGVLGRCWPKLRHWQANKLCWEKGEEICRGAHATSIICIPRSLLVS